MFIILFIILFISNYYNYFDFIGQNVITAELCPTETTSDNSFAKNCSTDANDENNNGEKIFLQNHQETKAN